jgi:hypothetical protein
MLSEDIRLWGEFGFGPWALIERETGVFVDRARRRLA